MMMNGAATQLGDVVRRRRVDVVARVRDVTRIISVCGTVATDDRIS